MVRGVSSASPSYKDDVLKQSLEIFEGGVQFGRGVGNTRKVGGVMVSGLRKFEVLGGTEKYFSPIKAKSSQKKTVVPTKSKSSEIKQRLNNFNNKRGFYYCWRKKARGQKSKLFGLKRVIKIRNSFINL